MDDGGKTIARVREGEGGPHGTISVGQRSPHDRRNYDSRNDATGIRDDLST